ncbi:MAG: hypothetical protein ABW086_11175 [Sedimenticola sp.]
MSGKKMKNQFSGLPMNQLIGGPLDANANSQLKMAGSKKEIPNTNSSPSSGEGVLLIDPNLDDSSLAALIRKGIIAAQGEAFKVMELKK